MMRAPGLILLGMVTALVAAEPRRQAVPIGGQWNLSGERLERAKMEGKRVQLLVAKGQPILRQGKNALLGPWTMEARAEVIECDFVGKKFVLRGSPELRKNAPDGKSSTRITGKEPATVVEISFVDGKLVVLGASRMEADQPPVVGEAKGNREK